MDTLKKIYDRSPYFIKILMANAKGYQHYLRRRYNRNKYLNLIKERATWSKEDWENFQNQKLKEILEYAAENSPFYSKYWESKSNQVKNKLELPNWLITRKEDLRQEQDSFISRRVDKSTLEQIFTSGTSGKPVKHYFSKEETAWWYAMHEARTLGWFGLSAKDRWINFGGQIIIPAEQKKPPFWVYNAFLNQLYLSSYHINESNAPHYIKKINHFAPAYIYGYTSSIYNLAVIAEQLSLEIKPVKFIFTNAEPLFDYQREKIETVFNAKTIETYGGSEKLILSNECEFGKLHYFPDNVFIEVLDDNDEQVEEGREGRIVATTLNNFSMPLIRYEIGDIGSIKRNDDCECGRNFPVIKNIQGRIDDVIITPDGRRIGRLDPVFKGDLKIKEAQIIQVGEKDIVCKIVADKTFSLQEETLLRARLQERLAGMNLEINQVDVIPKLKNGKFKAVVNQIKKDI